MTATLVLNRAMKLLDISKYGMPVGMAICFFLAGWAVRDIRSEDLRTIDKTYLTREEANRTFGELGKKFEEFSRAAERLTYELAATREQVRVLGARFEDYRAYDLGSTKRQR